MPRESYQLSVKNLFLTYPQVQKHYGAFFDKDLCLSEFREFLEQVQTNNLKPAEVSLCVEEYPTEPNKYHVHALLTYPKVLTHNLNHFKFQSIGCHNKKISHGRANLKRIVDYFKKDGCYYQGHEWGRIGSADKMDWDAVINAPTRTVAEKLLREKQPKLYIQSYSNVQNFLSGCFEGSNDVYEPPSGLGTFTLPTPLSEWMEDEFVKVRGSSSSRCSFFLIIDRTALQRPSITRQLPLVSVYLGLEESKVSFFIDNCFDFSI